jgi:hypothetical protein
MIMTKQTYNGWTNYETWCWKLWQDNDEGTQAYWSEAADDAWKSSKDDDISTRTEDAANTLSERMKSEAEDMMPEVSGVFADLLNAAMSEINWHEIACNMLEDDDIATEDAV